MEPARDRQRKIFSILGVLRPKSGSTIIGMVKDGLPLSAFDSVAKYVRVTSAELSNVTAIPQRRIQRRSRSANPTLDREESDRLARVARLLQFADEVLGSPAAAKAWMTSPNPSLDGMRPFDLLATELEAREVEDALGRILHGVFA